MRRATHVHETNGETNLHFGTALTPGTKRPPEQLRTLDNGTCEHLHHECVNRTDGDIIDGFIRGTHSFSHCFGIPATHDPER